MKKSLNPWTEYYAAKSQSEKEEILKKIYPGITQKGLEFFKRELPFSEDAKESTPKKLELTDEEIMDYAVQLFIDNLPKLDEFDSSEKPDA